MSPRDCHLQVGEPVLVGARVGMEQEGPLARSTFFPFVAQQAAIMSALGDGTRSPPKSKGKVREQRATLPGILGRQPVSTHHTPTHPTQTLSSFFGSLPGFSSARNLVSHTHSSTSTKDLQTPTDPSGTPAPSSKGEWHKRSGDGVAWQSNCLGRSFGNSGDLVSMLS